MGWMMEYLLEINNLLLRQGDFTLQIEQLSLQAGCLYSLEGENGSGKSTLLRLLALMQKPEHGLMKVAGRPVVWQEGEMRRLRQQITLLEQNPLLFSGTVEQNLTFGLKIRGIHGRQRQERIEQALTTTGLSGFNHRLSRELSGGETRRVALARALVLKPQLLLLDEPTANLDGDQVAALEQFLLSLPEQGISVVIANHDRRQPERLGGEILRLRNGKLLMEEQLSKRSVRSYPNLQAMGDM